MKIGVVGRLRCNVQTPSLIKRPSPVSAECSVPFDVCSFASMNKISLSHSFVFTDVITGTNHFGICVMGKDWGSHPRSVDVYVADIPYPPERWLPCKVDMPQSL